MKPYYEYSGQIRMPQTPHDKQLFESGQEAFREGMRDVPFPGADTWADMMTNQGWVFESRKVCL